MKGSHYSIPSSEGRTALPQSLKGGESKLLFSVMEKPFKGPNFMQDLTTKHLV